MSTTILSSDFRRRAPWISRLLAIVLVVVSVTSSVAFDPVCVFGMADTSAADDAGAPCPCPLDCAACSAVRAVPSPPPRSTLEPILHRIARQAPPIEADTPPSSPDPAEISHVPKA